MDVTHDTMGAVLQVPGFGGPASTIFCRQSICRENISTTFELFYSGRSFLNIGGYALPETHREGGELRQKKFIFDM